MLLKFFLILTYLEIMMLIFYLDRKKNGKYKKIIVTGESIARLILFSWRTRYHWLFAVLSLYFLFISFMHFKYKEIVNSYLIPSYISDIFLFGGIAAVIYIGYKESRNLMKE